MDLQPDEMPSPPLVELEEEEEYQVQKDDKDGVHIVESTEGDNTSIVRAVEEDGCEAINEQ